jgi:O6-methylguanine-DNA--protein-cysteine methyltransferase
MNPNTKNIMCYCVPVDNNQFIGFVLTQKVKSIHKVYYNSVKPSSKEEIIKDLREKFPDISVVEEEIPEFLNDWASRIISILSENDQHTADIPLDLSNYTEKQQMVIKTAHESIPVNEVYSYGKVATMAGLHGAFRFVGTTMKNARQPWIIPCHRVKSAAWIKKQKRLAKIDKSLI